MPDRTCRVLFVLLASLAGCGPSHHDADVQSMDATDAPPDVAPACRIAPSQANVTTFHRDRQRRGWDPFEPALTPAAVSSPSFGLQWNSPQFDPIVIAGRSYAPHVYATPLYVEQVCVAGGAFDGSTLDLVFAATSNGFVYAVSASNQGTAVAGAIVWSRRLGQADNVPSLDGAMPMGVLSTPVIDLDASPPRLYVASMDAVAGWQVFALDLRSGAVLPEWPVTLDPNSVMAANRNGPANFQDARVLSQRGALNLSLDGGVLYVPFGAYYDGGVGWLIAVDTRTPHIAASFSGAPSMAPEANGGIWGPGGVSVDDDGTVCATTGNSPVTSHDAPHVWGQTLLCWDRDLNLVGTYTPWNYCQMDVADTDLGGSSPVLLPRLDGSQSSTTHLVAFGGKQGNVYLVDLDHLSRTLDHRPACSTDSSSDLSLLPPDPQPQFGARGPLNVFGPYSEMYGNLDRAKMRSTPAYFRDAAGRDLLFVSGSTKATPDSMMSVAPSLARVVLQASGGAPAFLAVDRYEPTLAFVNPGSPVVTSNGNDDAVVWVLDENAPRTASLTDPNVNHPVLYAVDGDAMRVLWQSDVNQLFVGGKYSTLTAARGTVFVATDRIQAFGVRGP